VFVEELHLCDRDDGNYEHLAGDAFRLTSSLIVDSLHVEQVADVLGGVEIEGDEHLTATSRRVHDVARLPRAQRDADDRGPSPRARVLTNGRPEVVHPCTRRHTGEYGRHVRLANGIGTCSRGAVTGAVTEL
jgi:hypothetical protein